MRADLDQIAQRLRAAEIILQPMQVAGGKLTPLQVRRIVGDIRKSMADARMAARRIGELMAMLERYQLDLMPKPQRPVLRVIEGGVARTARPRRRAAQAPDDQGPHAA